MTLYPRIRIGDLVTIKGGKRLRPNEQFSSEPTRHPYIRARDVGEGIVKIQDAVYLPEDVANRLSRYRVTTGDVCITIVGANVGEMGIVPPNLDGANLTENCVRLTNNGKVTQGFLRYSLLGDDAQGQMKVLAGGAAQPKLGIYKIETVEIPLPSVPTQRKIASILSAYDDLIENNNHVVHAEPDSRLSCKLKMNSPGPSASIAFRMTVVHPRIETSRHPEHLNEFFDAIPLCSCRPGGRWELASLRRRKPS
ncbi:EcoKI restriction-modification system protein HsdS [Rubripirellula tenax]|uniref:EcoKI restriction-modification system protein HsdS n=1 Tax=Rubripirellula tenax TaxID=2528015 RepID=A0A5C6EGR7_9BACT|nr:EcoKI restriction-modification system protein HsdS [Rubripirellula tenax]